MSRIVADAVLTDDRSFANLLGREGVAVLLPTTAIVLMAERRGTMGIEKAAESLGKIKGLVRRSIYEAAMVELKELIGKEEEPR